MFWVLTKAFLSEAQHTYYLGLIFRVCSSLCTILNPFWRVTVHGSLPAERPRKLIVMSNHVSNADPWVTLRAILPWESKYIAKSDLFKVPFGGWAMSLAGDIPVYFTAEKGGWGLAKGSVGKMMQRCEWLVNNGSPITVFPEGARSGCMEIRDFKPGMFKFAIDNGCDILPLALNNTHKAWSRNDVLDVADIHVRIGDIIKAGTETDVEALKNRVRDEIVRLTATLPNTCNDDLPRVKPAHDAKPTPEGEQTVKKEL